jgi:hypothetical protein
MASKPVPVATGVPISTTDSGAKTLDTHEKTPAPDSSDSARDSDNEDIDGDYGSYHGHVFSDEKKAEYWRNVYETAQYEGRHRFDPTLTWTAKEEKALKRKVGAYASQIFSN